MSIEKTEKKTEAVKEAQPVTETTGAAAYCGPTVKGIAPQYTVFVDGLPEKLKEKVEQVPFLKALIVGRRWCRHLGNTEKFQGPAKRNQERKHRFCK